MEINQNLNELRDISSLSIYPNPEHIDLSNKHDSEKIVEISPNRRYAKVSTRYIYIYINMLTIYK